MVAPPMCLWCKHFNVTNFEKAHQISCEAFPNKIPDKIWESEFIHQKPYEGDNKILFEVRENPDESPKTLKVILETLSWSFEEALNWYIAFLENAKYQKPGNEQD